MWPFLGFKERAQLVLASVTLVTIDTGPWSYGVIDAMAFCAVGCFHGGVGPRRYLPQGPRGT